MHNSFFRICLFALLALRSLAAVAQMPNYSPIPAGEKIDAEVALERALKTSSLMFQGKPFHAVMEIGTAGAIYSGRVEVWWAGETKYKLIVTSPQFSQDKVVNGDLVSEKDTGDYYPRWLENFVLAILDPVPMAKNFHIKGPQISGSCLKRENKPGGITDELTFTVICLKDDAGPQLDFVLAFNEYVEFQNIVSFGAKKIARTYQTRVLAFQPVVGFLSTLEELNDKSESMFTVEAATPAEQRIATDFVSTLTEEHLVEKVPEIQWPGVREGKTEGYMIVYARTDRTGQVRETAKHNSDQPGLESFGMQQALRYKFKPLVVDGVARQMEMPLVLHFTSKLSDPIPELDDTATRKLITGCSLPHEVNDPASAGQQIVITFQVHEDGGLMTLGSSDRKIPVPILYQQFRGCHFGSISKMVSLPPTTRI